MSNFIIQGDTNFNDTYPDGNALNDQGLVVYDGMWPSGLLLFGLLWRCGFNWGPGEDVVSTSWSNADPSVSTSWSDGDASVSTTWIDCTDSGLYDDC